MESEFWAAIAGSVVGGLIAVVIQALSWHFEAKRRTAEAKERNDQIAYGLFYKLHSIANDLHNAAQHLIEAKAKADERKAALWCYLVPIINLPSRREIQLDELVLLQRAGKFDLLNAVRNLELAHGSMLASMGAYGMKRSVWASNMPAKMNGVEGTADLTQDQMDAFGPLMADMGTLADQMGELVPPQAESAMRALTQLNDAFKELVGKKFDLRSAVTGEPL